jgi:nicotinate phosphoribosyltransferase
VRGTLFEAQLVETYLLSVINFQTSVASKAARIVGAAKGRGCVEFGTRRAHGPQAGVYAARAGYIGGLVGTSNVFAAQRCGIPVVGTAAHAFTMACPSEEEAFARYAAVFPEHTTLLIDTYDTKEGARRAAAIKGVLKGVRIDSGDFVVGSKEVREILDAAGRQDALITLSGDLNEWKIEALIEAGAAVDRFGVGTELVTSRDHPALGGVYKLVSRMQGGERHDVMKLAEGKMTYPGVKQVWRQRGEDGRFERDVIRLEDSGPPQGGGEALLVSVMEAGEVVYDCPSLERVQRRCKAQVGALSPDLLKLTGFGEYTVAYDEDILALVEQIKAAGT